MPSIEATVEAVAPAWPELSAPERAEAVAQCARFLRAQLRLAPFHIRMGFRVLFAGYGVFTLLRAGPFPDAARRASALSAYSSLPLPMVAGLERLIRSMTLLAYFETPAVIAALNEVTPGARQAEFRARRNRELVSACTESP